MITFQKIPIQTLDPKTGIYSGAPKKNPVNIGMDAKEFESQIMALANKKIPIKKVYQAIDAHKEITDKGRAKSMAEGIYSILGK